MPRQQKPKTQREVNAERILDARRATGPAVTERLNPPPGTVESRRKDDQRAFWRRSLTPEQEAALWQQPGMDVIKVSQAVYKRRWELFSMTRPDVVDQVKWIEDMIRLGPPDPDEPDEADAIPRYEVEMSGPNGAPPEVGY